jgi:hypothetical protein
VVRLSAVDHPNDDPSVLRNSNRRTGMNVGGGCFRGDVAVLKDDPRAGYRMDEFFTAIDVAAVTASRINDDLTLLRDAEEIVGGGWR